LDQKLFLETPNEDESTNSDAAGEEHAGER
jgi:hypothetical protein